jgi:hypothetical protein
VDGIRGDHVEAVGTQLHEQATVVDSNVNAWILDHIAVDFSQLGLGSQDVGRQLDHVDSLEPGVVGGSLEGDTHAQSHHENRARLFHEEQGEMTLDQAKRLGADLLRELRYGDEGYFWADTTQGVNVVLYGRQDVEGKNRLEAQDRNGAFFIKEFLALARAGGGYTEYWFPKRGETTPQPKRSYVLLFKPFGWVVGSGYYP